MIYTCKIKYVKGTLLELKFSAKEPDNAQDMVEACVEALRDRKILGRKDRVILEPLAFPQGSNHAGVPVDPDTFLPEDIEDEEDDEEEEEEKEE